MTAALGWALMVLGALWMLLASIGIHRMSTAMSRLLVAGKAATLGIVALLVGAALVLQDPGGSALLVLAAAVLLITTPAGAQALASALRPKG